jgi:hypothetical protein
LSWLKNKPALLYNSILKKAAEGFTMKRKIVITTAGILLSLLLLLGSSILNYSASETVETKINRLLDQYVKERPNSPLEEEHKKEILSWGEEGIKFLLQYSHGSVEEKYWRKTRERQIEFIGVLGKRLSPSYMKHWTVN